MNDRHPLLARILHTYMGIVVSDTPLGVFSSVHDHPARGDNTARHTQLPLSSPPQWRISFQRRYPK